MASLGHSPGLNPLPLPLTSYSGANDFSLLASSAGVLLQLYQLWGGFDRCAYLGRPGEYAEADGGSYLLANGAQ